MARKMTPEERKAEDKYLQKLLAEEAGAEWVKAASKRTGLPPESILRQAREQGMI